MGSAEDKMPIGADKLPDPFAGERVSLFIPLYNEEIILEESVATLVRHLDAQRFFYEIILGSNGSSDRTCEIGSILAGRYRGIRFFHIPRRGRGLAFREAVQQAAGSYLVCLDADLSTDLNFIGEAVMLLVQGYDAVVGSKSMGRQKRPIWRVMASEVFILAANMMLSMPYRDYSIGAKAYRIAAVRPFLACIDRHTFYTQELLYQLQRCKGRIIEIPVCCEDRRGSRFNLLHEGLYRYGKLCGLWLRSMKK